MKSFALFLLLAATCAVAADKTEKGPAAQVQEKFAPGGFVRLHLGSGGYRVIDGDANTILVSYNTSNSDELKQVKVKIKTGSASADVFISDTPRNNFRATIEVPARSDLRVRMFAGEVVIDGVEGDKDVEVDAGRIEIRVPKPDDYGRRDASVHAGSIEASVFHISKGGLFRSFDQKGPGKYRLHAHVATGEIDLTQGP